jgi:5-methylcytosine-specific restriction endonuclease McrA
MAGADARLSTTAWRRLRLAVLDRDLGLCQVKGPHCTRYATCVDHIIARADGGDCWSPANPRASCRHCNSSGGADITNTRRRYRTGEAQYITRL